MFPITCDLLRFKDLDFRALSIIYCNPTFWFIVVFLFYIGYYDGELEINVSYLEHLPAF